MPEVDVPEVDVLEIAPALHRIRIPGGPAHLLNAYAWLGEDDGSVTLVDTGWPDSAAVIRAALVRLGRSRGDVTRIVLTHFHDDHAGAAAEIAGWAQAEVVAGAADAPFVTGEVPGPLPSLTERERGIHPDFTEPPGGPPCPVTRLVDDGDVLPFAGGATVLAVPGHTPGSIALHLPDVDTLLTGDAAAEFDGQVILGVFDTDRPSAATSLGALARTGAGRAGFGHGEAVLADAAGRIRDAADPFADG